MSYGILFVSLMIISFVLGFLEGELKERKAWNKLISDGTLPSPEQTKKSRHT